MTATQSASTVRALVRGTRTALVVQLIVAAIALGATVFAVVTLQGVRAETARLQQGNDQLRTQAQTLTDARDHLQQALPFLTTAYQAWARGDLQRARDAFNDALGKTPDDPSTLSAFAQVQFALGDADGAADAMTAAVANEGNQIVFEDYAHQAAYQCAAGKSADATATLASPPDGFLAPPQDESKLAEARAQLLQLCKGVQSPTLTALATPTANFQTANADDQGQGHAGRTANAGPAAAVAAAADDTAAYHIGIVYLHIRSNADRADAQRLADALKQAGYRVPGIELVAPPRGYGANIRYYYEQQTTQVADISARVTAAAHDLNLPGWSAWTPRQTSLAGQYDRLPRDRLEVWLPPRDAAN